jgi:hypothetical protein
MSLLNSPAEAEPLFSPNRRLLLSRRSILPLFLLLVELLVPFELRTISLDPTMPRPSQPLNSSEASITSGELMNHNRNPQPESFTGQADSRRWDQSYSEARQLPSPQPPPPLPPPHRSTRVHQPPASLARLAVITTSSAPVIRLLLLPLAASVVVLTRLQSTIRSVPSLCQALPTSLQPESTLLQAADRASTTFGNSYLPLFDSYILSFHLSLFRLISFDQFGRQCSHHTNINAYNQY